MDRKIQKKTWTPKFISLVIAGVLVISLVLYQFIFADNRPSMNVPKERLTITEVKFGEFTDYIPVSGIVEPAQTFFLDAIEGGTIQRIVRESGMMVKAGDTLFTLTNSNLQLDVMQRETMLYEQINNLRQTRLLLDQNDLNQQAQLAEIDYQIGLLRPQYERFKKLHEQKLISDRELEEVKEQYEYNVKRKRLTYASYRNDSIARTIQMRQLRDSEERMTRSLNGVGHILDNLVVKAPISGQLALEQFQVGQSISNGQRYGQIDILDKFNVRVQIDELYLPRITTGLRGTFPFAGANHEVEIKKIYPNITNGRFEVDMDFVSEIPSGIRRGQTVRIRLELGESQQTTLLATGGFYSDTGGNWVFVIDPATGRAVKTSIRLGRKNPEYYEVLDGLKTGDKVIISSYENFGKNEILNLK
jgi:HlyD family secretion protein